ncbi:ATP synthase F1 subunit delta [Acidihalobacter yilgarnensis]|uniref:ATP synthase subunit delta n=1 Tax=Acidihalobacter yilgarnensis TaxID=2819280 RepID=A0A1D8ISE3_9GAMM|nr:F0F1 ATP synthase subunit delta [Acidihalobacter yilgarnensis]AOU99411.1 ATP synthase F1 subunit delta [Acidihalobacter yilgarnensis]
MSEQITFARPYARAAFELAQSAKRVPAWKHAVDTLATIVALPDVQTLILDPRVPPMVQAQIIIDAGADAFDAESANLVRLLAENRRLQAAPELALYYESLCDAAEGTIEAEAISAYPLDETQRESLVAALKRRLGKNVNLSTREDSALLAGVVVHAGDLVIDGSLKGRLGQMARAMSR